MTTPTAAVPEDKGRRRAGFASNAREGSVFLLRYGMVFVLIVMVVVTIVLDSSFLDRSNLLNLLLQWAPVGLMAIGMTYVIIAGGFDLRSAASMPVRPFSTRAWLTTASLLCLQCCSRSWQA